MSEASGTVGVKAPEAGEMGMEAKPRTATKGKTPRLVKPLATWQMWAGLAALTALGAFLRYWRLDFQAYWTDEAYTIERLRYVSVADMLQSVKDTGFPPGWYMLLRWWRMIMGHFMPAGETYQPGVLRTLPALMGTLTVPAMYFLARQFMDRKGSLLVTLLAAVNPFLIYYARDIKMYAVLMFLVTLNMALFFEWQTSRKHWLWFPLFALSGVAMTAMHALAFFIPGLQLVYLLTRPRPKGFDAPLWALAVGLAVVIPCFWYYSYTQPEYNRPAVIAAQPDQPAQWEYRLDNEQNAGMAWITEYTDMSRRTVVSLPMAHILGYLWPVYPPDPRLNEWFLLGGRDFRDHLATRSWPWMVQVQIWGAIGVFTIMVVGLFPWRGIRRSSERDASATRGRWWWVLLWIAIPIIGLALTWIPHYSVWYARVWGSHNPKPLWEPRYLCMIVPAWLLWLGVSLRRLPTIWVRAPLILGVAGACAFSSLSNHLLLRNAPMHRGANILEKYIDNKNRNATAVAFPMVKYEKPTWNITPTIARHVVPGSREDQAYQPYIADTHRRDYLWPTDLMTQQDVASWVITQVKNNQRINTLVLTDRFGDLTADKDVLSDEYMKTLLGPRWERVYEESYKWHYEWRFYIFHTWRTRVWKVKG
jgi:4-amino-4-deoxy-L-arabinose transferase-like glycosyltransferase